MYILSPDKWTSTQSFEGEGEGVIPVKFHPSMCFAMGKIMRHLISFPFLLPRYSTFPPWSPSWQCLFKTVSSEGNLKKISVVLEDELSPAGLWICKYHSFLRLTYMLLPAWGVSKQRLAPFIHITGPGVTFQTLSPLLGKWEMWSKGNSMTPLHSPWFSNYENKQKKGPFPNFCERYSNSFFFPFYKRVLNLTGDSF